MFASSISIWAAPGKKKKEKEKKGILGFANSAWIWHSGMSHHTIFLEGVVLLWLLTAYWGIKCLPGYNSEQMLVVASVIKNNCCNCAIFIHTSFFFPYYLIYLWLVHLIHLSLCIWAPNVVPSEAGKASPIKLKKVPPRWFSSPPLHQWLFPASKICIEVLVLVLGFFLNSCTEPQISLCQRNCPVLFIVFRFVCQRTREYSHTSLLWSNTVRIIVISWNSF